MGPHSPALLPPHRGGRERGQDPPSSRLGGLTAHTGHRRHSLECATGMAQPGAELWVMLQDPQLHKPDKSCPSAQGHCRAHHPGNGCWTQGTSAGPRLTPQRTAAEPASGASLGWAGPASHLQTHLGYSQAEKSKFPPRCPQARPSCGSNPCPNPSAPRKQTLGVSRALPSTASPRSSSPVPSPRALPPPWLPVQ